MKHRFAAGAFASCLLFIVGCQKPAYVWQRVFTSDQRASAEFPCATTTETVTDAAKGVSIRRTTVNCKMPQRDIDLHLSYNEIPPEGRALTVEQRLAAMRGAFEQQGCTIISSVSERNGGFPGGRMVMEMSRGKTRCTMRIAVASKGLYRVVAASASGLHADPAVTRFVESFSLR